MAPARDDDLRHPRALRDVRGAISLARVPRLVYAATDPKGGAAGGVIDLYRQPASAALNHRPDVEGGLLSEESKSLLEDFFAARR